MSEPSVRFGHESDWMDDSGVSPEGQDGCLEVPDIASRRYDSTGPGHGIDRPVFTDKSVYTNTGSLGFQVTLGEYITDWPDPVDPPGTMEQVVFPGGVHFY